MVGVLLCFFMFRIGGFAMIKNISDLTLGNLEKEINEIKKELKCPHTKIESLYIYASYDKPICGKKSSTIKEPINSEGLERIVHNLNKLKESSNTKYLAFGIEYQGNDPLGGARDLLVVKRAA
jgi:hypothetical protein